MHASQPVQLSANMTANSLGSFFLGLAAAGFAAAAAAISQCPSAGRWISTKSQSLSNYIREIGSDAEPVLDWIGEKASDRFRHRKPLLDLAFGLVAGFPLTCGGIYQVESSASPPAGVTAAQNTEAAIVEAIILTLPSASAVTIPPTCGVCGMLPSHDSKAGAN